MKILVIDGDAVYASVLREKLEKEKFDVEAAENGDEAYGKAAASKPDLIVVDMMLPKKDGFEVISEIRADRSLDNVPIFVVSQIGGDVDIKRALDLGAANFYAKDQHPIAEIG